ncbi:HAD family hydrolase [Microbispora sp. RL4-1S]|uniref:HAD family hydrolase n=1 Tax=Microbispora oryzae TaxID=2806554 RepID=A0A940WMV5_9ACTN|nr:HAD family hydrolase [Microbispora oryzae]MBP2705933.1 HAD family hydrolase [Microbispora oryzae]
MTIRGVLFDIDDTIFDYSASERTGLVGHLAAEGLLEWFPTPDDAVVIWRQIMDEEYTRCLAGEMTFEEQQLVRTRRFLTHIGRLPEGGLSDAEAAAWFARYVGFREAAWAAFPDAEPVLRKLGTRFRLGVVSNSSLAHQRRKLRTVGLLGHFGEAIVCSIEHGVPKPEPGIFLTGCALLGLPPHQVAYVGDRLDVDALGALAAGLRPYWIDRTALGVIDGLDGLDEIAGIDGITVIRSLDELAADLLGP